MLAPAPLPVYLTPQEARVSTIGVDIRKMSDEELLVMCSMARDLVDGYIGGTFGYQETKNEAHDWQGENLRLFTYNTPIRTVQDISILGGVAGGKRMPLKITASPPEPTPGPYDLPSVFGDLIVDRDLGMTDATSLLLTAGSIPLLAFMQLRFTISYTSGFDEGAVQPDGYSVPYPSWLRTATRWVLRMLLGEWEAGKLGLSTLQDVRVADTAYRRPIIRSHQDFNIPSQAKMILDRHHRVWVA